jgi:hypothetical protein
MYDAVIFTDMSTKVYHVRPLGAYRIASELRKHGYSVLVVDFFGKWLTDRKNFIRLLKKIISPQTKFVGYSGTFFSLDNSIKDQVESWQEWTGVELRTWPTQKLETIRQINSLIKDLNPECKIFYGGAQASNLNKLQETNIDYVVQGLADGVIVEIMRNLTDKKHIKFNVKNNLRVIDYDIFASGFDFPHSLTRYESSDCFESNEILPLETSRGCIFKCAFCSYPLLGRKKDHEDYNKNPSVLAQELKDNWQRFGVTNYMFVDDTFNESTYKLEQIYQAIKLSGVDIKFSCYLRLDLLERFPEQIELLKNMGIQSCFLGIETLNAEAGRAIGKTNNSDKVKNALEKCRAVWGANVSIYASFIVGLPNETEQTVDEWMDWVYNRKDLIDAYYLRQLHISQSQFPSELCKNPEQYGYQIIKDQNHKINWINNTGMDLSQSRQISDRWMEHSWHTNRLSISGFEAMGLQNLGYSVKELKQWTLNTMPYSDFAERYRQKFARYQQKLFDYLENQIN